MLYGKKVVWGDQLLSIRLGFTVRNKSLKRGNGRPGRPPLAGTVKPPSVLIKSSLIPNGRWFYGAIAVKSAVTGAAFPALSVTTPW